ncbi:MAG: NADH-quinone oxidoreductase subunit J [Phycisphaerales bacterium]
MDQVVNQVALYVLLALGAAGVLVALPRKGLNPQPIGMILAAAAGGLLVLLMSLKAGEHRPNLFFYIFAAVGLGSALRVVTHHKPVYAALYFIMTIFASAGLFVILSAEFLAFALVIVYAGAILITYLFVIMLATQSPAEEESEVLAEYDTRAREPLAGVFVGFVLLAVLTSMMFRGVDDLPGPGPAGADQSLLAQYPGKVMAPAETRPEIEAMPGKKFAAALDEQKVRNIEAVAYRLLADHPGAIEIAGVILLMAMLGAVVLARKQVQLDEEAKARHAASLASEVTRSEGAR